MALDPAQAAQALGGRELPGPAMVEPGAVCLLQDLERALNLYTPVPGREMRDTGGAGRGDTGRGGGRGCCSQEELRGGVDGVDAGHHSNGGASP